MIFRPPIKNKNVVITKPINISKSLVKDTEKIEQLVEKCKELGLEFSIIEDAKEPITRVLIAIPYKEELL